MLLVTKKQIRDLFISLIQFQSCV